MRVLVAPDKFRGTLTARQAAEAVATGWRRTRPEDRLDLAPMADGGEGTMASLVDALDGEVVRVTVAGPREDPVGAAFGVAETAEGRVAIVEMASASGLDLLSASRRDPRLTTTRGTGELIAAALDRGPVRLIVGPGRQCDERRRSGHGPGPGRPFPATSEGREIAGGGLALAGLARVDVTGLDRRCVG
jgi:glycerate kinase